MAVPFFCPGQAHSVPRPGFEDLPGQANKTIPTPIRAAAIEALSHYPELRETSIEFVFDADIVNVFMQARPKVFTLLYRKCFREYTIQMLPFMIVGDTLVHVYHLPHAVLVGWLGHELGHIMDYENRSGLNMIFFGFQYLFFPRFVAKAERRADLYALEHGLGKEIAITKEFILNTSDLPQSYKNKIKNLYMSPAEVLELLKDNEEAEEEEDEDDKSPLRRQ